MIGISSSSYYYKPKISPEERAKQDTDLRDKIEQIHVDLPGYGYRRIREHLKREGINVNWKKIRRVMREYGLLPEIKRAYVTTTDSKHGFAIFPNLVKGLMLTGLNQVWVSDITYIRIATCFVYLAVVIDLYSRKVIGWAIAKGLGRELALGALRMALENRQPPEGCIHHSDRGVQYACHEYVELLKENKLEVSMAAKGNPYENPVAESFMKTLKREEVYLWNYETYTEVIERLPYFIEEVYNKKRLHSSLGYLPPDEFEKLTAEKITCLPEGVATTACKPLLNSENNLSS